MDMDISPNFSKNLSKNLTKIYNLTFKGRALGLFLFSFTMFLLGTILKQYIGNTEPMIFSMGTSILLIAILIFTVGFLFFGYLTPVIMFAAGDYTRVLVLETGAIGHAAPLTLIVSSIIVGYSGIMLGDSLLRDMSGKGNFFDSLKISMVLLAIGLVIAVLGDFVFPIL